MATERDAEPLRAIFRFRNQRPSATQSETFCWKLRDTLGHCVDAILKEEEEQDAHDCEDEEDGSLDPEWDDRTTPLDVFSPQERKWLRRGWRELFSEPADGRVGDVWTLQWFPAYGSVLQTERIGVDMVALRVLALDKWEWRRHFLPSGENVDSAVPTDHVVFACGHLPSSAVDEFSAKTTDAMQAAAEITGTQRSAALAASTNGGMGHQKTPQFLVATVREVMERLRGPGSKTTSHLPRGGMTDVGLHTGGAARDTCWPLVCAALRQALPRRSVLLDKLLLVFHASLMDTELPVDGRRCFEESSAATFWNSVNECFEMLESIVDRATRLDEKGYDAKGIVAQCERRRSRLDAVAAQWSEAQADKYRFHSSTSHHTFDESMAYPSLGAPDQQPFAVWRAQAGRQWAMSQNAGSGEYVLLEDEPTSVVDVLVFLESIEPLEKAKTLFGLRLIEKSLLQRAATLNQPVSRDMLNDYEPEPLLDLMAWYHEHMAATFIEDDEITRVQRQSVYALLSWIAFCLAHRHCCDAFADVRQHKLALDWRHLEVCVLHEATCRVALLHVAKYICDWNAKVDGEPLFDLSDQRGTLLLARRMGQSLPIYQDLYLDVVSRLRLICESQWESIAIRKRHLDVVRQEINSYSAALKHMKQQLRAAEDALRWEWKSRHPYGKPPPYLTNSQTQIFSEEVFRLTDLVRQKQAFRDELVQMPEFVVSPLPQDQEEALQILFLMVPPPPIDHLAQLCWCARASLTPPSSRHTENSPSECAWIDHVEGIIGDLPSPNRAQFFSAVVTELNVPTSFGATTIDDISSAEAFTHACVWFPNGVGTTILWRDDTEQDETMRANPFEVEVSEAKRFFTPQLPVEHSSSQPWLWAVSYPGDSGPDRGNMTYSHKSATVDDRGNADRATTLLILGALRAYPTQQIRRIFSSVTEDSLLWSDHLVGGIVRQALYQVGVIAMDKTDTSTATFLWHRDLARDEVVQQLTATLTQLVESIKLSPRRWKCIPLLSDLARFLSQYDVAAKPLLLTLARLARRWALELRDEWQRENVLDEERRELRCRECFLYGYGVLCLDYHTDHTLAEAEVTELCELLVLFHNAKLFAAGERVDEIEAIARRIDWMMANHMLNILKMIKRSQHKLKFLTNLAKLVLPRVSDVVNWRHIQTDRSGGGVSCCFIGVSNDDGSAFVINLFTGSIMTNGGHPMSLPLSIRGLPLFHVLFEDRDFEVTFSNGVYETTTHNELSLQYRFSVMPSSGELSVEEVSSDYTLQLCSGAWRDHLQQAVPVRLSSQYTPWCWMKKQTVLLRGLRATDTAVYYVMRFDVDGTTRCYEVPRQDRSLCYASILKRSSNYPVLVAGDARTLEILEKFENIRYIHSFRQPAPPHALEISLPRFGLRFVRDAGGRLASLSHRGYVLSPTQQLAGQMLQFRQYLLLEQPDSSSNSRRLLVPMGSVRMSGVPNEEGYSKIEVSEDPGATVSFLTIDRHPRLEVFAPETLESRLQLAALYAASGSLLPWTELRMTGGEASLEMLRGCSPSRPLSTIACDHLVTIATQFAFRTPVLAIFAGLLLEKSRRLSFLFDDTPENYPSIDYADALDAYRNQNGSLHIPYRQQLTRAELSDLLGSAAAADLLRAHAYPLRTCKMNVDGLLVDRSDDQFVKTCETELKSMCGTAVPTSRDIVVSPSFPLSPHGSNAMSTRILEDLQESWNIYHSHVRHVEASALPETVSSEARTLLNAVRDESRKLRGTLELCCLNSRRDRERLASTVSRTLDLTISDVMRAVVEESALLQMVPFLSKVNRTKLRELCIQFLELCVLEDKLERIACGSRDTDILEELRSSRRSWEPSEHPYWLVFEVETRMQIRHEQFVIAMHLIDNPGSICQLNMGRGKTRVILPMLFLYFSYELRRKAAQRRLVRAHFLSPLLSETRELMWKVLTSTVLALPFIELPYNRSCIVTAENVSMIRFVLDEARRNGSVVMVAPEHRLSLELEQVELSHQSTEESERVVRALDEILDPDQFIDVFDESDALLHHGYHLVYAVGTSKVLDGGATRWLAAEALLRVLISRDNKRVQQTLHRYSDFWSIQPEYIARTGGESGRGVYNGFRLHTTSSSKSTEDQMKAELRVALVEDLIDQPPFDFEWLALFGSRTGGLRSSLVRLVTDASLDADDEMRRMPPIIQHVKQHVLALRGLLAFNILEVCLQKRYRVEYGHPPAGSRRKDIAVPFQAADLPSDRSEFSHPDVGITLTLLAFYHSGLSDAQILRAFEVLLSLDDSENTRYYHEWYTSSVHRIESTEEREMLSSLKQLSTDNVHQSAIICKVYRFAVEVINFYLNFCVFPKDTRQFPHRLTRSAWDLSRGKTNIGFSGTNDTHYLLPHGVVQREPDEPTSRGTNGKMIQLLLDATRGFEALSATREPVGDGGDRSFPLACWQSLLLFAVDKQCHTLIDTGALLAGVSTHDAARFLVSQPDFAFQGVTYYDTRPQFDAWVVLEKDRDLISYHKNTALRERDTFVVFDEARARGSDMKLGTDAIALLTLGPSITKDKLMQGAGRMRMLSAQHQTLWLTSTHDVYRSIALQAGLDTDSQTAVEVVAVLNWVVDNTQRQCTVGLLEWAQSGIQFYGKIGNPAHELQDDDWTLEGQYGSAQTEQLIADVIKSRLLKCSETYQREVEDTTLGLVQIESRADTFGRQDAVRVTNFDEECEREVQIEEEQQEDRAMVRHNVMPCMEQPWNWCSLLLAVSVDTLLDQGDVGIDIISLNDAVLSWFVPVECSELAWETTKIHATMNFWSTVVVSVDADTNSDGAESIRFVWTSYIRQVHTIAVFPDASVLLLSEFEANAVLEMLHEQQPNPAIELRADGNAGSNRGCFAMIGLPFVVDYLERMDASPSSLLRVSIRDVPLATGWNKDHVSVAKRLTLSLLSVIACCLLNGDTELYLRHHAPAAESALRSLLAPVRHREDTLQKFISLRGFTGRWKRSSLHAIARRMDLEDAMKKPSSTKAKASKRPKQKQ